MLFESASDDFPSPCPDDLLIEVGRLCQSWAYLENLSEVLIWSLLDLDAEAGEAKTRNLDMRGRWATLMDIAPNKLDDSQRLLLKKINKHLVRVTRDRNIIVHGLINARAKTNTESGRFDGWLLPPAWIVQRGKSAGKRFPVSLVAARTVRQNIQLIAENLETIIKTRRIVNFKSLSGDPEKNWPVAIESID